MDAFELLSKVYKQPVSGDKNSKNNKDNNSSNRSTQSAKKSVSSISSVDVSLAIKLNPQSLNEITGDNSARNLECWSPASIHVFSPTLNKGFRVPPSINESELLSSPAKVNHLSVSPSFSPLGANNESRKTSNSFSASVKHSNKGNHSPGISTPEASSSISSRGFEFQSFGKGLYRAINFIGKGSYGEVYGGINTKTSHEIAIKFEDRNNHQLATEREVLNSLQGKVGFPKVYYFGLYSNTHNLLIMDLLGASLGAKYKSIGSSGKFSLRTVCLIAIQLLIRFEDIHDKGYIYNDVKPDNFLLGLNNECIHVVDFGLSRKYNAANIKNKKIVMNARSITGTSRYASINAHYCRNVSRRDDIESLGYMFIYFLKDLPWCGLKFEKDDTQEKILRVKRDLKLSSIKDGSLFANVPAEFKTYFKYCRALDPEQKPDYIFLKNLFRTLYVSSGFPLSPEGHLLVKYDWSTNLEENEKEPFCIKFEDTPSSADVSEVSLTVVEKKLTGITSNSDVTDIDLTKNPEKITNQKSLQKSVDSCCLIT